jgi:hypothetical protein
MTIEDVFEIKKEKTAIAAQILQLQYYCGGIY